MLRIAIQSKGRLNEDSMALLSETGIKLSSGKRTLLVQSPNFPVEVLFLRDDDIPDSVASGESEGSVDLSDVKPVALTLGERAEGRCGKGVGVQQMPPFSRHTQR